MRQEANDNSYLFENEVKVVEELVARQPDLDLTAFRVFAPRVLANPEADVATYHVADTDNGAAELLRGLGDYPRVKVSGSEVENTMRKIGIKFEIPTADIEQSRFWGRKLDAEFVERAKRAVDDKINQFIYLGDSTFGINGVYELTGVTTHSGSDLDTSSLNLCDEVTKAVNAIPVQFRKRPYTLVIADQEWKKFVKIGNTYSNETWLSMVKKAHPNLDVVTEARLDATGTLGSGGTVPSGAALLIPKDKSLCRMPVGFLGKVLYKPAANAEFDEKVQAKVKARVGPVEAPFPTAIVKITGWN